ncbi:D-alanyl-D-alanine carboxypeptidase family protein [Mongoliimonas terrestris]|uniref:D-alanyl-D-alanine carboxypeptidase family protein n=1 Tax=Mongoliimonas terrestris TaxID=1709001 RepID=UPI001FDAB501|nr:D-alanyl-D-alanine carboxypeptidase family protein [Mongoliimonas terrestris]
MTPPPCSKPPSASLRRRFAARLRVAIGAAVIGGIALAASPAAAGPYLVFDVGTGEVLAERDAFHPWYPASLTKMMTAYVTFRAVREGRIRPESPVVMTANAAKEPPSKMGFKPGTAVSVDTALKMLIVKSANDLAVALAETVGGSEQAFVDRMNAEARRLGMTSTRFANPNGLPDARQWTTARDYALLTTAIIREFPEHHDLFRITALSLGGKLIRSHNHLLERYPGTDGMKTGFICASGFNVVATATRGNRRLAAVVFGEENAKTRAETTARLLEAGFGSPGGGLFAKRTRLGALAPSSPVPAAPLDMRPTVCGKKAPVGEDAEDRAVARAGMTGAEKSFLVERFKLMDPVPVALAPVVNPAEAAKGVAAAIGALPPLPRARPDRAIAGTPGQAGAAAFAPDPATAETAPLPEAGGVRLDQGSNDGAALVPLPGAPPIEILGLKGRGG